MKLILLIIN